MKQDKDILIQINHRDGMTTPDGYFEEFAVRMAASLPKTEYEGSANAPILIPRRTFWQKVRPYVYMAAMFGGVWCMLKMFTLMTSTSDKPWEPSPIMAEALGNEVFVNDYIINNVDEWELMEDMVDNGFDIATLNDSIEFDDMETGTESDDIQIAI